MPKPWSPDRSEILWGRLVMEEKHDLIEKLSKAERREPGYGTIVVTKQGFSEDDTTHNMVIEFLEANGINTFNPGLLEARMERALHPVNEEE